LGPSSPGTSDGPHQDLIAMHCRAERFPRQEDILRAPIVRDQERVAIGMTLNPTLDEAPGGSRRLAGLLLAAP
jgi:hypothetical protein